MSKREPVLRFPEFLGMGGWEVKQLCEFGELVKGLTYRPDDIRKNGLLVLRSSNVQNSKITFRDNVYVRSDIKGANLSEPDDILICVRNGSKALIGKSALIPKELPKSTHGAFMTIFRATFPAFVYQLFQTEQYLSQVSADLGATINSINNKQLKKFKFYVPKDKGEQQKIADCLSSIDELITAQTQKLKVFKTHKKGLMQQLFPAEGKTVPKRRFPEFKGGWCNKKLKEITKINPKNSDLPKSFIYIDLESVENGILTKNNRINKKEAPSRAQRLLKKDDILYQTVRPYQKNNYFYNLNNEDYVASTGYAQIRTKQNAIFVFQYLHTENFVNKVLIRCTGTSYPAIKSTDLSEISINIPSLPEQQKIADCLSSIDELITAQTQKLKVFKVHKKGLMQQLFPSMAGVES